MSRLAIPRDALCVIVVGALMPIALHLYHLAPWVAEILRVENIQSVARGLFSLSFAGGCFLVGHLIERGGPHQHELPYRTRDWHVFTGHAVTAAGMTAAMMAILSLQAELLTSTDQTMTWRLLTGIAQAVMVFGWAALWYVRRSWLSHTAAGYVALASAAGLGLYVISNFLVEDPLTSAWGWGVLHPQSLVARVTGQGWIEPCIAALLWVALGLLLRRWWRRQSNGHAAGLHR